MNSLHNDPTLLELLVHFRLGQQDPVKAWLRMRLFIAAVDYSTPAEVFQVAQQLEELPAVVNGFESDIDVWHFIFQRQEEALKSSVSSQNSTVMNQNKKN